MNSFNHYAYGAIGDWMYRVVAGLEQSIRRSQATSTSWCARSRAAALPTRRRRS